MARNKTEATEWDSILEDLVIASEPPMEYIKSVMITTKEGVKYRVSPQDFAYILEREKLINPENSDIQSARFAIDIPKIKRDVDRWAKAMLNSFDETGRPQEPKFSKPKAANPKPRTPKAKKPE